MYAQNAISVILCTHNPRTEFIQRTLLSLKAQTQSKDSWELILIDNGSREPLANSLDVSWHPHARIIREDKLGLTFARIRGISESQNDLLVFLDDDNILDNDYLSNALRFGVNHPFLGAWGGSSIGEFETPPPAWAKEYLCYLAIRKVERTSWGNDYRYELAPIGAGMCIRRSVAESYIRKSLEDTSRKALGRRGASLVSGEDSDMAFVAIDDGYGIGLCHNMSLKHIMPASRLDINYLERLMEGIGYSSVIVLKLHGVGVFPGRQSRVDRWLSRYRLWKQPAQIRRLENARARGRARALAQVVSASQGL